MMLNFFSGDKAGDGTVYRFREPSLDPAAAPARARSASRPRSTPTPAQPAVLPTNYGDIVAFFRRTVAERKSAYNQLCRAADQLKDYVPDEISRLKIAWKVLGEQVSSEALSLAISTHLNDIDLARQKAARHTPDMVAGETRRLQDEIAAAESAQATLQQEIEQLQQQAQALQARHAGQTRDLDEMKKQLQTLNSSVNSAAFLDQAAENEKNDLLARKVLLGLE